MAKEKEKNDHKLQITLAIISLIGVLGGALLANADKVAGLGGSSKPEDSAKDKGSDVSVDFSGNNNNNNQVITGDNVQNNTTNVFEGNKVETAAPENVMQLLSPGRPLEKAQELFGAPDKQEDNVVVYNQLDNLYIRLVTDSSNTICSATFQRKGGDPSVFKMYPIDIFFLGTSRLSDLSEAVQLANGTKESGFYPKGGHYASVTEFFGAAGQYLTYTFGISKYLEEIELEQLPYSEEKVDFVTVTDTDCVEPIYEGLRWYEYQ